MSRYGRRGPYRCFFRQRQNQRPRQGVRLSSLRKQSDSGQFLGDHLGEAPEPPIDRFHREASHSRQERLRSSLQALKLLQFAQVVSFFFSRPPASPWFVVGENGGFLRWWRGWGFGACDRRARLLASGWRCEAGARAVVALVLGWAAGRAHSRAVARRLLDVRLLVWGVWVCSGWFGSGSCVIKQAGLALLTAL